MEMRRHVCHSCVPTRIAQTITLGLVVACLGGCGSGGKSSSAALPTWTPDEKLVAQLEAPSKLAHGYQMRVPPEMDSKDRNPGGDFMRMWDETPTRFNGGQLRLLNVRISSSSSAEEQKQTLEKSLADWQKSVKEGSSVKDASFSPPESGTINGIPFLRSRLRGRHRAAHISEGLFLGTAYVAKHQGRFIFIETGTGGEDTENAYKLLETAILTFKGP
jgi:hypothetical protein